jgi:hypothetical protein
MKTLMGLKDDERRDWEELWVKGEEGSISEIMEMWSILEY